MASNTHYPIKDGENIRHKLWLRSLKLLNAILITIPFALCWYLYYAGHLYHPFFARGDRLVAALFFLLYVMFGKIYAGFTFSLQRISEIVYSQSLAILFSNGIIYIVTWMLIRNFPNLISLLLTMEFEMLLLILWSFSTIKEYFIKQKFCSRIVAWK